MPMLTKFHCDNCGGEKLIFRSTTRWTGTTFELQQTETRSAYCEDCGGIVPIFQSEEVIFGDMKPASEYDLMKKKGNL